MPSIYIINPAPDFASYSTAEAFGRSEFDEGWVQVADATIPTIAALVPSDWAVSLCDESISPLDLNASVDFVAITGKISQRQRMFALSREFRRRGRTVVIGGSFATLTPDDVRPHTDILVKGELEEIASTLFADLAAGEWKDVYDGGQADIRLSPVPRWDLYPVGRALSGAIQTTRGCPFNCEFCDVIQYQGRKQRHKTIEQVLSELDELHRQGFREIFIVDDNFTVQRRRAHALLDALVIWNKRHLERVRFSTQASLDVARDEDLLGKCKAAGLDTLFIGIETVNADSLRETGKRQNLLLPINDAVDRILRAGIAVRAGIIVGFDHDDSRIFEHLREFFDSSPIPDLAIGVLTAPYATDLHRRLKAEGRLSGESLDATAGHPFSTNIAPKLLTRDELLEGVATLCQTAYRAENYERRMMSLIAAYGDQNDQRRAPPAQSSRLTQGRKFLARIFSNIGARGAAEARMLKNVLRAASQKPTLLPIIMNFLCRYEQTRSFLDEALSTMPRQRAPHTPKELTIQAA